MSTSSDCSFNITALPLPSEKKYFCAEIRESSLRKCTALAWEWNKLPPVGSLVFIPGNKITIFACVTNLETMSQDPTHIPRIYKKTVEELMQEQPQLFSFLQTTLSLHVLGYGIHSTSKLYFSLPPQPALIHQFVGICSPEMHKFFFEQAGYFHLLFSSCKEFIDDIILAIIHHLITLSLPLEAFFHHLCDYLTLYASYDYRHTRALMSRVESIIQASNQITSQ